MGQAKLRGTKEERTEEAVEKARLLQEKRDRVKRVEKSLSPEAAMAMNIALALNLNTK